MQKIIGYFGGDILLKKGMIVMRHHKTIHNACL